MGPLPPPPGTASRKEKLTPSASDPRSIYDTAKGKKRRQPLNSNRPHDLPVKEKRQKNIGDLKILRGSEWGYFDNTKPFTFWLCNMKQLNFRHFNANSEKNIWNSKFFYREKQKRLQKGQYYFV